MEKLIESYEIKGDLFKVIVSSKLKSKYLKDDFWMVVENTNLNEIPLNILLVPFILNIAPVIWVSGMDFEIETLDKELSESLIDLKKALIEMYPETLWAGNLRSHNLISETRILEENQSVFLFSGGLDSIATSYSHLKENQTLVTIQGSDIEIDDLKGWKIVQDSTVKYSNSIKAKHFFVRSNFMNFLNDVGLKEASDIPNWWGFVQHGMGLSGLMAVPSWLSCSTNGYIGSTHSKEFYNKPWGSHPKIDNLIRWNGIKINHDCYDLTRQEKIQFLIKIVENGNPIPHLRVCYSSRGGKNCGHCEKCCRTINGLIVSGYDFKKFGFPNTDQQIADNTKKGLNSKKFKFNQNTLFHWEDLKSHIQNDKFYIEKGYSNDLIEFVIWLKNYDFKKYKDIQEKKIRQRQKIKKSINLVPGLFPLLKRLKGMVN